MKSTNPPLTALHHIATVFVGCTYQYLDKKSASVVDTLIANHIVIIDDEGIVKAK